MEVFLNELLNLLLFFHGHLESESKFDKCCTFVADQISPSWDHTEESTSQRFRWLGGGTGDCLRSCRSRKCRVIGRNKLGLFKSLMHAGTHSDVLGPKIILVRGWENVAGKWRQKCHQTTHKYYFGLSSYRAWRVCSAKCKKRRNRHSPSKTERATHSAAADSNCLSKSGGN